MGPLGTGRRRYLGTNTAWLLSAMEMPVGGRRDRLLWTLRISICRWPFIRCWAVGSGRGGGGDLVVKMLLDWAERSVIEVGVCRDGSEPLAANLPHPREHP